MKRAKVRLPSETFSTLLLTMLEENREVTIPVTGNSMYPLWKHNRDSVVLANCDKFSLNKGDIALYRRSSDQLVLHRIVKVNKESYDMCGDAQTQIERNLPMENVIAVVTSFNRNGTDYRSDHIAYQIYSDIWMRMRPVRWLAMKSVRQLRRLFK